MPPRKQKKNMKKLAEVLKECRITTLNDENTTPTPAEKPSAGMVLDNNQNETKDSDNPKIDSDVPPIFLHQPVDFKDHVHTLLLSGLKFYQPHHGRVYTKIKCLSFEDHRGLIQYLKSNKLPYHTYGNPDHRKIKVVIRGLPKDTCLSTLKDELDSIKIPVVRLHKMHTKQTAREHPLLVLAITASIDDGKKLMQVETLLGNKVKMEPPITKLRQCHRCQKWGHSQRYCHGEIRCVKCAGYHLTSKCMRDSQCEHPKCANCMGEHTANYKKCGHCPESDAYKSSQKQKWKVSKRNIKPKIVTLKNYQDYLYKNIISLAQFVEGHSDPEFDELENCEELY